MAAKTRTVAEKLANNRNVPMHKARLGLGQHPVLLRWVDWEDKEQEQLFDTGPLAVAYAHTHGLSAYEIFDA